MKGVAIYSFFLIHKQQIKIKQLNILGTSEHLT